MDAEVDQPNSPRPTKAPSLIQHAELHPMKKSEVTAHCKFGKPAEPNMKGNLLFVCVLTFVTTGCLVSEDG